MSLAHAINNIRISNDILMNLKYDFSTRINSKRRLEHIKSIRDLVDILWNLAEIGMENIDTLLASNFCFFNTEDKNVIKDYVSKMNAEKYPIAKSKF